MTIHVPSQYVPWLKDMSDVTGIPYGVCAAQAYVESDFNQYAVSPTGAQGWLQFEPYTWVSWGTGSPFNIGDAANAWIRFMTALLQWSGGSVWKALAAYNAGQGNWQAGIGYANEILGLAGGGTSINAGGGATPAPLYGAAPSPINTSDDWSAWIRRAASFAFDSGTNHYNLGRAIRRM